MSSSEENDRSRSSERGMVKEKKEKKDKKIKRAKDDNRSESKLDQLMAICTGTQASIGTLTGQVGSLQVKVDEVRNTFQEFKVETNEKFTDLTGKFTTLESKVDIQAQEIKALKGKEKDVDMKADFVENPYSGTKSKANYVHPSKRKVIEIRGFPRDSIQNTVEEAVKEMVKDFEGIVNVRAKGKLCSSCRVTFEDSDFMWALLRGMKGKKFTSPVFEGAKLWHQIEQTEEERNTSIRTSIAVNEIRSFALEKNLCTEANKKTKFDGDWTAGYVFMLNAESKAVRLLAKNRTTKEWEKTSEADANLKDFDFGDLLEKINGPK